MSLTFSNRIFRENIPRGLELKPSDFRPKLTGIDISFLLNIIAETFSCYIYCDHNVSVVEDVKFFLLGELHQTEFHKKINTLFVRLFVNDESVVFYEDQVWGEAEDKTKIADLHLGTQMINTQEIQRNIIYKCWDLSNLQQYLYSSAIKILHLKIMLEDALKALDERTKDVPPSPEIEERIKRAHFVALKIRSQCAAEGNFQMTPELLKTMQKVKQAKHPLSLKLLEICGAVIFVLSSRHQMINKTFPLRQASLSTAIKEAALLSNNSFFLAGYRHFFEQNDDLETNLIPALEETGMGYLATRLEETIYHEDSESLDSTYGTFEEGMVPPLSKSDPRFLDIHQHTQDLIDFSFRLIEAAAEKEKKVAYEFLDLFKTLIEQIG